MLGDVGIRAGDVAFDGHEEDRQRGVLMPGEHGTDAGGRVEFECLLEIGGHRLRQELRCDPGPQAGGPRQRRDDDHHLDHESGGKQAQARQRDAPVQ